MARIRSIKPEFWDDRKLAKRACRDARLLYIALWNLADEHGRVNGDPQWIKGQVFSYDDDLDASAITKLLEELEAPALGAVVAYEVDGDPYLFLPKLAKHQRLEPEKVKSRLPAPPDPSGPRPDGSPPRAVSSEPRTDLSEPGADESARDSDQSGPGAGKPALLYVAGSREHGAGSMYPRERAPVTMRGVALLEEHITACAIRPPKDVLRTTGEKIDSLLAEEFTEDQIRAGLRVMRERGKGPGLLPHLVSELVNPPEPGSGDRRVRRGGAADPLTDQRYGAGSTDI